MPHLALLVTILLIGEVITAQGREHMPRVEEAVFAKVNGKWRFEGFFDDRILIADVKRHIDITYGTGNFFAVVLPIGRWVDARFVDTDELADQYEEAPHMMIECPKCKVAPRRQCETVRGNASVRPHSQRVRAANLRALTANLLV